MIDEKMFIKVWNSASSVTDASRKLALTYSNAQYRACLLRKQGIKLKAMKHSGRIKAR